MRLVKEKVRLEKFIYHLVQKEQQATDVWSNLEEVGQTSSLRPGLADCPLEAAAGYCTA